MAGGGGGVGYQSHWLGDKVGGLSKLDTKHVADARTIKLNCLNLTNLHNLN